MNITKIAFDLGHIEKIRGYFSGIFLKSTFNTKICYSHSEKKESWGVGGGKGG